jgi:hypothetical protein
MREDDIRIAVQQLLLEHDAAILEEPVFSKRVEIRKVTRNNLLALIEQVRGSSGAAE